LQWVASVLLRHENQSGDKHVESKLVPRLDESSNLSSSTIYVVIIMKLLNSLKSGRLALVALVGVLLLCGCISEKVEPPEVVTKRNILFYIAADEGGVEKDVQDKIGQIREGWKTGQGEMLIYADRLGQGATLMRINEAAGLDTLEIYGLENSADRNIFGRAIDSMVTGYPADSYGLIFFSHASGWLPKGMLASPRSIVIDTETPTGERQEMEIADLAAAIPDGQFDFIIFEACLMGDVMTMYALRNKTKYVLVSVAEIVSPGYTYIYKSKIMSLFDTKTPLETVVRNFGQAYADEIDRRFSDPSYEDYHSYTLSLIKTSEMSALAATAKTALQGRKVQEQELLTPIGDIQSFDRPRRLSPGRTASRYFDLAQTYYNIIVSSELNAAFSAQLNRTVVWEVHTDKFLLGDYGFYILRHCGLSTYIEQDVYPELAAAYEATEWFKATR